MVGVGVLLYRPGKQGMQLPSFNMDPSMLDDFLVEGLWKPLPMGQVVVVMF